MNPVKTAFALLIISVSVSVSASVKLDGFEQSSIRIANPTGATPETSLLWNQYGGDPTEGPDPGSEALSSNEKFTGNKSLEVTVDSGNIYIQFYPKINSTTWDWMRNHITDGTWQMNTYNRMRLWVKLPPGVTKVTGGRTRAHLATYYRATTGDKSSAESGGNHYYHYYNLESTGEWHQIIVDWHPNAIRGQPGATDYGQREHPSSESGYNYFDLLTRFYFDVKGSLPAYPAKYYIDDVEFYREPYEENIDQVYALNGVFVPSKNEVQIGWMRHKDENDVNHEVRYAFSNIHELGWNQASVAPSGTVKPTGWQGYNGMNYSTTGINIGDNKAIYLAIKPINSSEFRQIVLPISGEVSTIASPPQYPDNLHIQILEN